MLILFSTLQSLAQENSKSVFIQTGVSTSTTANYSISGTDTALQSAFTLAPFVRIMHKSGLGLDYALNTLSSGGKQVVYMNTATAFYESYDRPVNLNFNYTHFFFSNNTHIPYTPISNELYAYVSYKKTWLAPVFIANAGFGQDENNITQGVFNLAAGVTHNFNFVSHSNNEIDIAPSIILNGGNNGYYSFLQSVHYITQNTGSKGFLKSVSKGHAHIRGRGSNGSGTTTTASAQSSASQFTLSNIELNLYSSFHFGSFELVPDGSIFIPVVANSAIAAYWQLKLAYTFTKK
ncbi:MAG: hypothetical protein JWR61_2931 [Ferruginibacter sp.]|nr:hypothetical protein [Ferruginibacter sp.]